MERTKVLNLSCIVEGKGETQAVRVLFERISTESDGKFWVNLVNPPLRTKKGRLLKRDDDTELRRMIGLAALNLRNSAEPRGVLVLIDADDDCPAELGPELLGRATRIRSDIPFGLVIAKSEFESWILAGIEGLRGKRGIPDNVRPLDDPESIRDAKGILGRLMGTYKETVDQPALTSHFDLHQARRRCDSFDKLCREIHRLVEPRPVSGEDCLL